MMALMYNGMDDLLGVFPLRCNMWLSFLLSFLVLFLVFFFLLRSNLSSGFGYTYTGVRAVDGLNVH